MLVSGSFRQGVWQSFSLALVAEIGDKTFFIACIMAMRYNRVYTFFGSWLALCVMTGLSCALGTAIKGWVSPMVVHYIAASLFLAGFEMGKITTGLFPSRVFNFNKRSLSISNLAFWYLGCICFTKRTKIETRARLVTWKKWPLKCGMMMKN